MDQTNKPWYKKWWAIALFIIIGLVIIGSLLPDSNNSQTSTNQPNSNQATQNENSLSSQPLTRIEQIVKNVGDYEVTIWDSNGDFATENSVPYEIIVNGGLNQFSSCFEAKEALYETMKDLYSDGILKGKISRVLFTAPHYLRSSAGYDDVKDFTWDYGISNYWKVTLQYKNYKDESGSLSQRTWGVKIDENCD